MLWNIWYCHLKLREMLYLTIFWCYGSIKDSLDTFGFWTFRTFWETLGKKVLFRSKTVFLRQEKHYYICMVYIAYYTELNWQFCNSTQKGRKYAPDENFCGHFCPRRKAANFCHPDCHHHHLYSTARPTSWLRPSAPVGQILNCHCITCRQQAPLEFGC